MRAFSHWINTMQRCDFPRRLRAARPGAWSLVLAAALCAPPLWAQQVPFGLGNVRNFPEAALRGKLAVLSTVDAELNGRAIRMAPGMRLFSPQNSLVMLHTVIGQSFKVNYVIEPSTGMLLTAWILTEAEAAQPRPAAK
ncbi:hypothetical protein IP95_01877 [Extensimonas vulgaris]|uniref:Uncharacterized protein n=2 Tax=Extensimonas vulgaris TaxID=1031594 RepID=A0A369AJ32_9BURK|nr:hypothetical protein DFR45_10659 [Extensimonas vulgaris]TWI37754.1 hypothetical protein IP95_01877 [Extensimonas vulgaris]